MINLKKTIASILAATMAISMLSVSASAMTWTWTDPYGNTHVETYSPDEEAEVAAYIKAEKERMRKEIEEANKPYSNSDTVDKIASMKYYGKALTSAPIYSDAQLCAAIQYAAAQGATKITLKYADSYTDAKKKAWSTNHSEIWGNETLMLGNGVARTSVTTYDNNRQLALFVYAYRYGHSDLIKQEDEMTQELYNKCVQILKECGVNDKNKSDMEKISAILNWLNTNISYGSATGESTSRRYYNAIVLGGATCGGYSNAFQLLTRMAGYKSWCVDGTTDPSKGWVGGGHGWNAIRINGELRFVEPQKTDWIMTYDELSDYGYKPDMTEKQLEMYCKY